MATTCPICEGAADEVVPGTFDGKHIRCRTCDEFRVTGTALGMLASRPRQDRPEILARARRESRSQGIPEITSAMF